MNSCREEGNVWLRRLRRVTREPRQSGFTGSAGAGRLAPRRSVGSVSLWRDERVVRASYGSRSSPDIGLLLSVSTQRVAHDSTVERAFQHIRFIEVMGDRR